MERGNHANSIDIVEPSTQLGYRRRSLHDGLRRKCSETANHLGTDHCELPAEKWIACADFVRLRIAIIRRPALQDVADVDVVAFEIDGLDDLRQQLSRPS